MFLLDTNVVSELRKLRGPNANPRLVAWAGKQSTADFHVSAISIMEIEIGIQRLERRDADRGGILRGWMNQHLLVEFSDRILPVDAAVALRCASLHVPNSAPYKDAFIAATALVHNMTVVTRNVADFVPTGVALLNPWDEQA